jgi:hypothetical protein
MGSWRVRRVVVRVGWRDGGNLCVEVVVGRGEVVVEFVFVDFAFH